MSERLEKLKLFLENSPEDSFLLFAIAKEYETLEKDSEAQAFYQKILQTNPDYVGLYFHLGKLYLRSNDLKKAVATYDRGMEVAKKAGDRHAYNELAGAKMEIDDGE